METTPVTEIPAAKAQVRPADHAKPGRAETAAPADAGGETAAVEIDLTEAGEEALQAARPGKDDRSPAHQARAFLAERGTQSEGGEKVPFGQIVSRIARGLDPEEAFAAPAEEVLEEDTPPGEDGETGVVDDGAPAPTVESGDTGGDALVAELLDDLSEPEDEAG